jgi:hypothetical protein
VIGGGSIRGDGSRGGRVALADGMAMPDAAAVSLAGALALDSPFLEGGAAAAAE